MIENMITNLFQCIFIPLLAIIICLAFQIGIFAFLDILSGKDPTKESLSMFFQKGAIFGSEKSDDIDVSFSYSSNICSNCDAKLPPGVVDCWHCDTKRS